MYEAGSPLAMEMKVKIRLLVLAWVTLTLVTAQDVYDLCLVGGVESEILIRDIPESTPIGNEIVTLNIPGTAAQVNITAEPSEYFVFDQQNKTIILNSTLDVDDRTFSSPLHFLVKCRLLASSGPMVTINVRVFIQDVNDNPPVFPQQNYYINVSETDANGSVITSGVRATDQDLDTGSNGLVYYSILPSTHPSYFDIKNPVSSDLTLVGELDYETGPIVMSIKIVAMDQPSNGDQLSATATLHISVLDLDDLPPRFDRDVYEGNVMEDSPKGTIVNLSHAIVARDQDLTINASVQYSIKIDSNRHFAIDPQTAVVSVNLPPPAEIISFVVQATQTDNSLRHEICVVRITVMENNKNPPSFQQTTYPVSVPESLPLGATVVTVTATDRDLGTHFKYYFVAKEEVFSMDEDSGEITLAAPLDYETVKMYVLEVGVSDGQFNATATVTVEVSDVNDNNPVLTPGVVEAKLDRVVGTLVTRIQGSDVDTGSVLTFSLASYSALFSLSGGELRIQGPVEDLIQDEYDIVIVAFDNGVPPRQSSTVVKVKFPALAPPDVENVVGASTGGDTLAIILGILAAILLIAVIIMAVYIVRRRLQSSEQLDQAKNRNTMDPRGIMFKKHPGSRTPSRGAIHFHESEESSDGATTVAENPFTLDGNSNYGYVHSDESENDRDMDEIQIETAVIPYRNGHSFPTNGDIFRRMEDEDGLPMTKLDHSYQNGSLSTFKDSNSNDSLHSDSTSSKRGLMKNMNGIATKSLPLKQLSWAGSNGQMPSNKSLSSLDPDTGISPIDEKPEITVYF